MTPPPHKSQPHPASVGATQVASISRRSEGNGAAGRLETLAACAAPTARTKCSGFPLAQRVSLARRLPYARRDFVGAAQAASFSRRSGDDRAAGWPETLAACAAPTARSTRGWFSLVWSVSVGAGGFRWRGRFPLTRHWRCWAMGCLGCGYYPLMTARGCSSICTSTRSTWFLITSSMSL